MTTCIKCGAPIEDGELFCANCAQNGAAVQPRPAPLPAGRMQTPPRLKKQPAEPGGAVLPAGKGGSLCGLIDGKQEFCRDAERLHGGKLLLILCACFVIIGRHEKQRLHVLV